MRLAVRLDRRALRQWHHEVVAALSGRSDVEVGVLWSEDRRPVPREVEQLFALEQRLHGLPRGRSTLTDERPFMRYVDRVERPEVVLDLVGDDADGVTTWHLTFDGRAGEDSLLGALLEGRTPVVRVVDLTAGRTVATGRPGSENPGVTLAAFEDVLAGCTRLLQVAFDGGGGSDLDDGRPTSLTRRDVLRHAGRSVARSALRRVYRLLYRAPHWRVGWRRVEGPDVFDLNELPSAGWQDIPDDGWHFYADPFPIVVDGRTYLFVEDFDHRLGRGVISVVPFGEDGPEGTPLPVLEHTAHLSYPFVLEDAGEVWMIPETSGAGTVELYRATGFPLGWQLEEVLLEGMEVSDATPFRHRGRWWLSATVRDGGSFSDALHLWSADRLQGPWSPHARNPVLVDIGSARPAGRVVRRGGRLVRPVQDGRKGYGAALALAEITRLDDVGFEQRVVARLGPGDGWPGTRLHTLNRAGWLEVVDGSAYSPRLRWLGTHRR